MRMHFYLFIYLYKLEYQNKNQLYFAQKMLEQFW